MINYYGTYDIYKNELHIFMDKYPTNIVVDMGINSLYYIILSELK